MSTYLLEQPQTWKDSPKGSNNSRHSLISVTLDAVFEAFL